VAHPAFQGGGGGHIPPVGTDSDVSNLPWRSCPCVRYLTPPRSHGLEQHAARDRVAFNTPPESKAQPTQRSPSLPSALAWQGLCSHFGIAPLLLVVMGCSWRPRQAGAPHALASPQPLQEFLGHAKGERVPQRCCIPPKHMPLGSGHARLGDGGEEASMPLTITRAMGPETSAEPRQLERSHADIPISYKRKG